MNYDILTFALNNYIFDFNSLFLILVQIRPSIFINFQIVSTLLKEYAKS